MAAADPGPRFAHFLQPIKDLSKVWKIDIAEELEKYIEEVAQLLVTNPEDGHTQLNFAEAALLIQGSTAIYSRKVELLYQLVYQALDLLSATKAGRDPRKKHVQTGLWAPIPETDELITIDHLIKEGRNIVMDGAQEMMRKGMQRRVPLFLMPRDKADRKKQEFRISSCTVHSSGAYLLQESDAKLLDELIAMNSSLHQNHPDGPLVPAPPSEVQELDAKLQVLLRELPEEKPVVPQTDSGDEAEEKEAEQEKAAQLPGKLQTPATAQRLATPMTVEAQKEEEVPGHNLWALLDDDEMVGPDVPLVTGNTTKRLNAKKLLMSAEGLPDLVSMPPLPDDELWTGDSAVGFRSMLAAGHPVEALFFAVAGHLRPGDRYESQKAGFSAAWFEFEDLISVALAKRRQMKLSSQGGRHGDAEKEAPSTPRGSEHVSDNELSDHEGNTLATPIKVAASTPACGSALVAPQTKDDDGEDNKIADQRREVARLESMIQDAQHTYESTIRQHLQRIQKETLDVDDKRFPDLYANVRRWQDQLEPVLKEFDSRPEFDIYVYSMKMLSKMSEDELKTMLLPFAALVEGQPRWEVCRRFLTTLLLTNQGNTDILFGNEMERLNNFKVQLLKAEKRMISLDAEESVPAPLAPAGDTEAVVPEETKGPEGGKRKRKADAKKAAGPSKRLASVGGS